MTRKECLDEAAKRVLRDRQNEYGQPEDCFGVIAGMWTAYLGKCVSAHDVAAMMVLLKVARFRANPMHVDSAVDCAGYASCMAELATAWEREDGGLASLRKRAPKGCFRGRSHVDEFARGRKAGRGRPDPLSFEEQARTFARENPAGGPNAGFRPGDRVQVQASGADGDGWLIAEYVEPLPDGSGHRVNLPGFGGCAAFGNRHVRPIPPWSDGRERFKSGDPVEVLNADGEWERATCRYDGNLNGREGYWVSDPGSDQRQRFVPDCGIRPAQKPKAEGNCCQNGNGSKFQPGDRVQVFNGKEWVDCRYIRWKEPEGRHVVQYAGSMCAVEPEMVRPGEIGVCEGKARFQPGDKVQYRVTLPSASDRAWIDAEYVHPMPGGRGHVVKAEKVGLVSVENEDIRPAPGAEGCEELVQKDVQAAPEKAGRRLWMPPSSCAREQGGCRRGRPCTPTGEELAETAEEGA